MARIEIFSDSTTAPTIHVFWKNMWYFLVWRTQSNKSWANYFLALSEIILDDSARSGQLKITKKNHSSLLIIMVFYINKKSEVVR